MMHRSYGAFIASLGVVVLVLGTNETFAAPPAVRAQPIATHPMFRPSVGHPLPHHRASRVGTFWPGAAVYDYGPYSGEPVDVASPTSGDVHYTYTEDVPWDAVHRFPPNVIPSTRPYVSDCTTQTVTVPRHGGSEQTATVNIMRCY